jgi:hypothetical protein
LRCQLEKDATDPKAGKTLMGLSALSLQLGDKSHVTRSGKCQVVGKPTMEPGVGWVRVWTVKIFY